MTTMTSMVWEALASKEQPEQPEPAPVGPLFVHERLRDLSQTPPPVWPVFVLVYVACPLLVFVIIPAQIHLQWLRMGPKVPASLSDATEPPLDRPDEKRTTLKASCMRRQHNLRLSAWITPGPAALRVSYMPARQGFEQKSELSKTKRRSIVGHLRPVVVLPFDWNRSWDSKTPRPVGV